MNKASSALHKKWARVTKGSSTPALTRAYRAATGGKVKTSCALQSWSSHWQQCEAFLFPGSLPVKHGAQSALFNPPSLLCLLIPPFPTRETSWSSSETIETSVKSTARRRQFLGPYRGNEQLRLFNPTCSGIPEHFKQENTVMPSIHHHSTGAGCLRMSPIVESGWTAKQFIPKVKPT